MRSKSYCALAVSGALFLSTAFAGPVMAQGMVFNAAHAEMKQVAVSFEGAPDGMGLLQTAIAEAKVAIQHAGFAAEKPDDLDYAKTHMAHVRHAIDPSIDGKGPGLGFGFKAASEGVVQHTQKAISAHGASDNVKLHGNHVATSAGNGVGRADKILAVIEQIMSAEDGAEAKPLVFSVHEMTKELLDGVDGDGDGKVSWKEGEGGLHVTAKHVGFLFKGEDLEPPAL